MAKPDAPVIPPESLLDPEVACCAGCARLERPDCETVVLLSGVTVCTYCPAWLRETLARQQEAYTVLRMATREARLAHLESREAAFGKTYRDRLSAVVLETWERRRAAAAETADA